MANVGTAVNRVADKITQNFFVHRIFSNPLLTTILAVVVIWFISFLAQVPFTFPQALGVGAVFGTSFYLSDRIWRHERRKFLPSPAVDVWPGPAASAMEGTVPIVPMSGGFHF